MQRFLADEKCIYSYYLCFIDINELHLGYIYPGAFQISCYIFVMEILIILKKLLHDVFFVIVVEMYVTKFFKRH